MTDLLNNTPTHKQPVSNRKYMVIGTVLWVICFAVLGFALLHGRSNSPAPVAEPDTEGDGRVVRELKLVPGKDGELNPQLVPAGSDASPWDADGIADFSFTDCNGQTVTKQDLLGKPFVIGFVFTNCRGPCPNVTLQMRELQNRLRDYDFNLVTLTVDPERDTPEVLLNYAKNQGADFNRWKFLTGNQFDIYRLIQYSFKMPVEETKGADRVPGFEIIHSVNLLLVDAKGVVRAKFDARKDEDMSRLRKEIKQLAKRTTEGPETGSEGEKQ